MAPTYLAGFVLLVSGLFANHGVNISPENLNVTIVTLIQLGAGIVVMYRQVKTGRATWFGTRPQA